MTSKETAQWVIDNRYPKNEHEKVSDAEMYHELVDRINKSIFHIAEKAVGEEMKDWVHPKNIIMANRIGRKILSRIKQLTSNSATNDPFYCGDYEAGKYLCIEQCPSCADDA